MTKLPRIAFNSLRTHKTKTVVVGTVLFIGSLLLFSGFSLSRAMIHGMQKIVTRTFTGDIVLVSNKNKGSIDLVELRTLSAITNSSLVERVVREHKNVKNVTRMGKGAARMHLGEGHPRYISFILGADMKQYSESFTLFKIIRGEPMRPSTKGLWVNIDFYNKYLKGKVDIHDKVSYLTVSRKGFVNSVKLAIRGIYRFEGLTGFSSYINIMDINSYRTLFGLTIDGQRLSKSEKKVIKKHTKLLDSEIDIESMFDKKIGSAGKYKGFVNGNKKRKPAIIKKGASDNLSEYLAISVKNPLMVFFTISELNKIFKAKNLGIKACHWSEASGIIGKFLFMLNIVLVALMAIIFTMVIIVIMNAMVMTAMERMYEIGTMRAIGASRWFVVRMFFWEALFVGLIFGGLGALTGFIIFKNIAGLPAANQWMELVFGGSMLKVPVDMFTFGGTLAGIILLSVISSIYPAYIASRFSPLDAIASE